METTEYTAQDGKEAVADIHKVDRLFLVLSYVAFCGEFPKQMAFRVGGYPDFTRRTTHKALEEGYLREWNGVKGKRAVNSLRITEKGLDYIARKNLQVFGMIAAQRDSRNPSTHLNVNGILRAHAQASVLVMAQNAGALVMVKDKPSLMPKDSMRQGQEVDTQKCYFYSIQEIRKALVVRDPKLQLKGSQLAGVIVRGHDCYFLYFAGSQRLFWMRPTEENFVGAVESLLNLRGFEVRVIRQVVIGNRITVAKKLYKRSEYRAKRYFVLSEFYNNCYFVTNSQEGDIQLRSIIHKDLAQEIAGKALSGCQIPARVMRGYDAIELSSGRPVLLNFMFDMLPLETAYMAGASMGKTPVILCFDHQVNVMQSLVEPQVEVRGIGSAKDYA